MMKEEELAIKDDNPFHHKYDTIPEYDYHHHKKQQGHEFDVLIGGGSIVQGNPHIRCMTSRPSRSQV